MVDQLCSHTLTQKMRTVAPSSTQDAHQMHVCKCWCLERSHRSSEKRQMVLGADNALNLSLSGQKLCSSRRLAVPCRAKCTSPDPLQWSTCTHQKGKEYRPQHGVALILRPGNHRHVHLWDPVIILPMQSNMPVPCSQQRIHVPSYAVQLTCTA